MRVVQKFGGTSVGGVERLRKTAALIEEGWRQGIETAVVVSAMSGETDRLLGLADALAKHPDPREMDSLLATGEQVSAALLAIELKRRGVPAYSYTGAQAGFRTDSLHSRARIQEIESGRLMLHLKQGEVPVLTGFQGVDEAGNITTLGRGGSDTSAVALAVALKADVCDIYTDVDGVYTADPRLVPEAQKIDRIAYEEMLELASLGAKVLQTRSVEMAMRYQMPLHLRSSFENITGTMVTKEDGNMERAAITGITYNRDEAKITILGIPDQPGIASSVFRPVAEAGFNVDVIVQNVSEQGLTDITFTVHRGDYQGAMRTMQQICKQLKGRDVKGDDTVAKVSIVGVGMRSHTGVARKMFDTLASESINIQMITTSEIKITVVLEERYLELAVRGLHDSFSLEKDAIETGCLPS
ncbi:MAG: aspartate kinase [Mariprofundaceae bacterium]